VSLADGGRAAGGALRKPHDEGPPRGPGGRVGRLLDRFPSTRRLGFGIEAGLALTLLLVLPRATEASRDPLTAFRAAAVVLPFLFWVVICARDRRLLFEPTALNLPIALYTLLVVSSVIYSLDRFETLESLVSSHAPAVAVYFLIVGALATSAQKRRLVLAGAAVFLIASGGGIFNALRGEFNNQGGLHALENRNSNTFGRLLGCFYPFLLVAATFPRRRVARAAAMIVALLGLGVVVATFSRGAAAGALVTCGVWTLLRRSRWLAAGLAAFLVLLVFFAPRSLVDRYVLFRFQTKTLSDRLSVWEFDLRHIKERPVFGWGYGGRIHRILYESPDRPDREEVDYVIRTWGRDPRVAHEHSSYVAVLLQNGAVGLGLYMWIYLGALVVGAAALRAVPPGTDRELLIGALAGLVGEFGVHALVDRNNIGRWAIPLWVLLGLAMAVARQRGRPRE
jgi:O-antigen ligase